MLKYSVSQSNQDRNVLRLKREDDLNMTGKPIMVISKRYGYLKNILDNGRGYLKSIFSNDELKCFLDNLIKNLNQKRNDEIKREEVIDIFSRLYEQHIKHKYQNGENPNYDHKLLHFISNKPQNVKIIWGDCYKILERLPAESVQLMITSPPYYNARDYSQWTDLNKYLDDMKRIIAQCYRVLDNHHVFVFNIGDIFDNDNLVAKSVWANRRLPLGAYFIKIFEDCGFTFVDDYIWDKGQVQSQRHKNGITPYPFYQYPMNCYEHILIFHKHRLDKIRYPCPICGSLKVSGNTQSEVGLQSWECKNNDCFERSKSNRGKRFSLKTNLTQNKIIREQNKINHDLVIKWRRDIVKFSPVIKINSKGENVLGHTAPFPSDIPEMAINFFSYKGDIVLDPFAGSFTTAIVANKLNRIGLGIELRKDLFEKSIKSNIKNHGLNFDEY